MLLTRSFSIGILFLRMIAFEDARNKFVGFLREKRRATATILAYSKDIQQLNDYFKEAGRADLAQVTSEDIKNFLAKLTNEHYTAKSVSRKLNSIKTYFKFLKSQGYLATDSGAAVSHPKFQTKLPRVLSPMEYRALRDAARGDNRTAAIVEVLLQTGIRIGELANLHVEDIIFGEGLREGTMYVRPQEGHSERTIPLNKAVEIALARYLEERAKTRTNILFITKTGRPLLIRNIRTAIDRYFRRAGIEGAKVNDLRHTWVVHHLQSGIPLVMVSKLAGHKRLSTTERYLMLIPPGKREEKVKLEEL